MRILSKIIIRRLNEMKQLPVGGAGSCMFSAEFRVIFKFPPEEIMVLKISTLALNFLKIKVFSFKFCIC